jgi:hypothetical protein
VDLWQQVFRKTDDVVQRRIAEENVLIPIRQNLGDLQNIFAVNDVAAFVFEQIDGMRNGGQICAMVADRCGVPVQSVAEDVLGCIAQLAELGIIQPSAAAVGPPREPAWRP